MGVDILMTSAGFTACRTPNGLKGFTRRQNRGEVAKVAVFPSVGREIASPYDAVRCCFYDVNGEMTWENTLTTLFDFLDQYGMPFSARAAG